MDSIKHFFSELLTGTQTGDSWRILGMLLGTFLIGLITNYFLNRSRIRRLEVSLEEKEKANALLKSQLDALQEQHALQGADLKKANLELADKSKNLEITEAEKRTLNSRLNATLVDLDKSGEEFQEMTNRMEDLNDQILGLRTKNSQLNKEIEQSTSSNIQYGISQNSSGENLQFEQKIADLTAKNALLQNSIEEIRTSGAPDGTAGSVIRISELETENKDLKNKINSIDSGETTVTEDIEALNAEITQLEDGNKTLSASLETILDENEQLKEQLEELPQYESGNDALNNSLNTLMSENDDLKGHAEDIIQYESGNEILNATLTEMIAKNAALEEELNETRKNQVEWAVADISDQVESEELDAEEAKAKFKAAIGNQIAMANVEERDDLKQIEGIGPFIEEKLNDLGIYTFEQVSQLDEELIETLTAAIEFFPGRIERDDWVGQADRLYYTKGSTPQEMTSTSTIVTKRYATATEKIETAEAAPATLVTSRVSVSKSPDDLKKIEGIGPKIAGLLNNGGILTFAGLAATPVNRLNDILVAAGNRYKMHNPTTWPIQATLAANGEWDKLKELQDELDGGRDVAKG